jgi:PleD family two-component response regulator
MNTTEETVVRDRIESVNLHLKRYPFTMENGKLPVTLSYGVAFCKTNEHPTELIQRADALLYEAKASGRNTLKLDYIKKEENQLIM